MVTPSLFLYRSFYINIQHFDFNRKYLPFKKPSTSPEKRVHFGLAHILSLLIGIVCVSLIFTMQNIWEFLRGKHIQQ